MGSRYVSVLEAAEAGASQVQPVKAATKSVSHSLSQSPAGWLITPNRWVGSQCGVRGGWGGLRWGGVNTKWGKVIVIQWNMVQEWLVFPTSTVNILRVCKCMCVFQHIAFIPLYNVCVCVLSWRNVENWIITLLSVCYHHVWHKFKFRHCSLYLRCLI